MKDTNLQGFDWEEDDFLTEKTKEETTTEKEIKKEDSKIENTDDIEFFGMDLQETANNTKKNEEVSIYDDLYTDLKESGILKNVSKENDVKLDKDKFFELQQEDYELEVTKRLDDWAKETLDEDAREFIKFKRDGGKTSDFFKLYMNNDTLEDGDIEDEEYQDTIIRSQLKKEGWDKDEIEDRIEYLSNNNKKKDIARKYELKIKEEAKKIKDEELKKSRQEIENLKLKEEEFKNTIKTTLEESENINGFKILKDDKTKLLNSLTKKVYKISEGQYITDFQKKLSETFQQPKKLILLAKLLDNDFNMSDFEQEVSRNKVKDIKTKLEQHTKSSYGSSRSKSLADLFN